MFRSLFLFLFLGSLAHLAEAAPALDISSLSKQELRPYLERWYPERSTAAQSTQFEPDTFEFQTGTDQGEARNTPWPSADAFRTEIDPSLFITQINQDLWYRFHLENHSDQPRQMILDFAELLYNEIEVYHVYPQGQGQGQAHYLTGLNAGFESRAINHTMFAFPIQLDRHSVSTVYFRIKTNYNALLYPAIYEYTQFTNAITQQMLVSLLVLGTIAGIFMSVVLIAAFSEFMVRLLPFLAYLLLVILYLGINGGRAASLISNSEVLFQQLYVLILATSNIAIILISMQLFSLKEDVPLLNRLCKTYIAFLALAIALNILLQPYWMVATLNIITLATICLLLANGLTGYRRKIPSASIFLGGLSCFFLFATATVYTPRALIDFGMWPRHLYEFGCLLFSISLFVVAGHRLFLIRQKQKDLSEQALIADTRNQLKSEFLAAMSHEIRTPVNGVLGMAQLLQQTSQDESQRYYTDIIINSGRSLLHVINDILDFSKVEAGKLDLHEEYIDVSQILTYASTLYGTFVGDSKLEYDYHIEPDVPVFIKADSTRIQQIITNFLNNAFKFTKEGQIVLHVSLAKPVEDDIAVIRFSVKDTGIGISDEVQNTLFGAYVQADSSISYEYGGTGLGLAICKRLAALMGGDIGVNSKLGAGSEFWFEAPMMIDTRKQQELEHNRAFFKGKKIALCNMYATHYDNLAVHFDYWGAATRKGSLKNLSDPDNPIDLLLYFPYPDFGDLKKTMQAPGARDAVVLALIPSHLAQPDLGDYPDISMQTLRVPAAITNFQHYMLSTLKREAIADQPAQVPAEISKQDLHVLIAEDNAVNRKVIRAMLSKLDCNVTVTENGEEALNYVASEHENLDLVLMDCEMPVMNGYEATEKIRELEKGKGLARLPIFALTAHALPQNETLCLEAGMDSMLTKPIDFNLLIERLNTL